MKRTQWLTFCLALFLGLVGTTAVWSQNAQNADPASNPLIQPLGAHLKPMGYPNNGDVPVNTVDSARRLIEDLTKTYGDKYPQGQKFLERLAELETKLKANENDKDAKQALDSLIREASLANPLLDSFDKILVVRRNSAHGWGFPGLNAYTNDTIQRMGWNNELAVVSDFRTADPNNAKIQPFYRHFNDGIIRDLDLSFDAQKVMFSSIDDKGQWAIFEVGMDGQNRKTLSPTDQPDVLWFDSCYLPEEPYMVAASTAGIQGLPCENGGRLMVNLYRVNTETKEVRQLTFEQDSDWHPTIMKNGQVLYLRWEYTDIPHYFARFVFSMNPDGRNQRALYGSGSYFPTAYKHARQCPEAESTKLVGIVGGHHASPETGRMLIVDPNMGRYYPMRFRPTNKEWGQQQSDINIVPDVLPKEITGCVQEIPGWGRDVVGNVCDDQARGNKYVFTYPYPLSEKYFLVNLSVPSEGHNTFGLWLVDAFDNMTLLAEHKSDSLFEPFPVRKQEKPPVIPDNIDTDQKSGTVFLTDVYLGRGMENVPRGTAKQLRIFAYHYGYLRSGGHESTGQQSSWDIKRILGTVDLEADGSCFFEVPSNTPFAMQVLDKDGAAIAIMRSWTIVMPGEALSCNGCHENANDVTPVRMTIAARKAPQQIKPWFGPARSWGYQAELQPTLDKYCLGCHNDNDKAGELSFQPHGEGNWRTDTSYAALNPYVRRPGPETDLDVLKPMEYHASTCELIQMLRRGHHNVQLPREAWERFYTWIDLNAPYVGMWNNPNMEKRRLELQKLYANIEENPEQEYRDALARQKAEKAEPIIPEPEGYWQPDNLKLAGWPMDQFEAKKRAGGDAQAKITLNLGKDHAGNDVQMTFVRIPAGKFIMGSEEGYADESPRAVVEIAKPFWMSETEVTNQQYECFDPKHDTRYMREDGKDHTTPGHIANHPLQPVARVSWQEANRFCQWLTDQAKQQSPAGLDKSAKAQLPTEAQWEWAARAGSAKQFFYGDWDSDWSEWANLADASRRFTYTTWEGGSKIHSRRPHPEGQLFPLRDDRFEDNWFLVDYVKQCKPNAFGLYDMVGNVSEWTRSDYKAYPYQDNDGRNNGALNLPKSTRGGSWNNRPISAGSSVRIPYETWQKVYNVGIRAVIE